MSNFYPYKKKKDHLGNVRAVIGDLKVPPVAPATNFTLNVKEINNYFPYGMKINSRSYTDPSYSHRYGFNGMPEDNELKGEGNSLDFGARFYDPRVGRFLSLDPLYNKYPNLSPYVAFADNPIMYIDPDGEDAICLVYPNYNIGFHGISIPGLGHAGILLIDNKTGNTTYFSFGRYSNDAKGVVKKIENIGKVTFDKNGVATEESLSPIFKKLSEADGQKSWIKGVYIKSDKYQEMVNFADKEKKKSDTDSKDRNEYSIWGYNCGHFSLKIATQDPNVKIPYSIDDWNPIPIGQINWMSTTYPIITWSPKDK